MAAGAREGISQRMLGGILGRFPERFVEEFLKTFEEIPKIPKK